MANKLQLIVSAGGWAGFIASVVFNVIQYRRFSREQALRTSERAEERRRAEETARAQREKEQSPPQFYNFNGDSGPILISGKEHSVHGPLMHLWGIVTVVNSTPLPMKITPMRLVVDGEETKPTSLFLRLRSNPRERFTRISLRGNDKEDYQLSFIFPEDNYPQAEHGELWFESSNRQAEFAVPLKFSEGTVGPQKQRGIRSHGIE